MNDTPDPDDLLRRLKAAAGEPPLPPLRLAEATPSMRRGVAGATITRIRRSLLRIAAPALLDLVAQLEQDRARVQARLDDLERRLAACESRGGAG